MKILLTGFQPFGGESINPSWEAVKTARYEGEAEIIRSELPVTWQGGQEKLRALISEHHPDIVLMTGQAGGRSGVTVERIAVNCMEAGAPDNDGVRRNGEKIIEDAPDGLFATIPYRKVKDALTENGIEVSFSFSAGTYICNLVMFTALELARTAEHPFSAGFVHLPYLPEQAHGDKPSMPLPEQIKAIEIILTALTKEE